MNIFVLDLNQELAAKYHCDKHVVKMILETAQIMSTVVRESGIDAGYAATHKHHPCIKWAGESLSNWLWLKDLAYFLNKEYQFRWNHYVNHKSWEVIGSLPIPSIADVGVTPFALAMPEEYKSDNPVRSYRSYYRGEKADIAEWKYTDTPKWFITEL